MTWDSDRRIRVTVATPLECRWQAVGRPHFFNREQFERQLGSQVTRVRTRFGSRLGRLMRWSLSIWW